MQCKSADLEAEKDVSVTFNKMLTELTVARLKSFTDYTNLSRT